MRNPFMFLRHYIRNILVAIDQLINALTFGDEDETISGRMGKWLELPHNTWKWKVSYSICRFLNLFQKKHCLRSIELDQGENDLLK